MTSKRNENIAGKWSISTDGETYSCIFDTREEAIAEGNEYRSAFWIGQCVPPTPPEHIWDADDWIEKVYCHDDYSHEWAEDAVPASKAQKEELESEVVKVIAAWLDRHGLRPTHFNIDTDTVEKHESAAQ